MPFTTFCVVAVAQRKPRSDHLYEDVDMVTNHRYLTHKLDPALGHAPSLPGGVANPLPLSPTSEEYSYIPCQQTALVAETDTYEVMRPSESVKNTLPTTDNVCYSCNGR